MIFFSCLENFFPMKITNWLFLCWIDALIVTYVSTHQEWRNHNAWESWHFENISINIYFRSHTYMLICSEKKSNLLVLKRKHESFFHVYTLSMKKRKRFWCQHWHHWFLLIYGVYPTERKIANLRTKSEIPLNKLVKQLSELMRRFNLLLMSR